MYICIKINKKYLKKEKKAKSCGPKFFVQFKFQAEWLILHKDDMHAVSSDMIALNIALLLHAGKECVVF